MTGISTARMMTTRTRTMAQQLSNIGRGGGSSPGTGVMSLSMISARSYPALHGCFAKSHPPHCHPPMLTTPAQKIEFLARSYFSTSNRETVGDELHQKKQQQQYHPYQVWEFPATDRTKSFQDRKKKGKLLYEPAPTKTTSNELEEGDWNAHRDGGGGGDTATKDSTSKTISRRSWSDLSTQFQEHILTHFLPAEYPQSVAPGYMSYAGYGFVASVAGSAGMILSTQTLLLAVGIVGSSPSSHAATAPVMAGALNWVLKDGIGQLGGVLFASVLGKTRNFDVNPKQWRMTAAMTLDVATFLELLSPFVPSWFVLPIASLATIGKNIGFLTASASRAALHQALAIRGNSLADVTAKAGSQAIAAGLIGTSLGIGLSTGLVYFVTDAQHIPHYFLMGFGVLAIIHQGCTYQSLQMVPLAHLNRRRLDLVLGHYLETGHVLSPAELAPFDLHIPLLASSGTSSSSWLSIGTPFAVACPDSLAREQMLRTAMILRTTNEKEKEEDQAYILHTGSNTERPVIHLMFWDDATGADEIRGMMHAFLLRQIQEQRHNQSDFEERRTTSSSHAEGKDHDNVVATCAQGLVQESFPPFLEKLHVQGWKTGSEYTTIETRRSRRIGMVRL